MSHFCEVTLNSVSQFHQNVSTGLGTGFDVQIPPLEDKAGLGLPHFLWSQAWAEPPHTFALSPRLTSCATPHHTVLPQKYTQLQQTKVMLWGFMGITKPIPLWKTLKNIVRFLCATVPMLVPTKGVRMMVIFL